MKSKLVKFIVASAAALTLSAQATEVVFNIPSQAGRILQEFEQAVSPVLVQEGIKVNTELTGNCAKGYKVFSETDKPTIMMVYNGYLASEECKLNVTDENLVSTVLSGVVAVCARPDIKNPVDVIRQQKSATIGLGGADWPVPVIKNLNANFKPVVYSSSGDLAKGFAAGDTDFIITNMLRAARLMDAGKANCVATTSTEVVRGIEPGNKVFPQWKYASSMTQYWAVVGRNLSEQDMKNIRAAVNKAVVGAELKAIADKGAFNTDSSISAKVVAESAAIWALR